MPNKILLCISLRKCPENEIIRHFLKEIPNEQIIRNFLKENPNIASEIENKILKNAGIVEKAMMEGEIKIKEKQETNNKDKE